MGFTGSILRSPAMPRHLPANRRHRPLQTFGYLTHRRTGSDSSRDILSLRQCKREQRAPTGSRNNPAALRQHKLNGHMVLAEGSESTKLNSSKGVDVNGTLPRLGSD